jgi:hypothetical protein
MNTEDTATLAKVGKLVLAGVGVMLILIVVANMI